MTPAGYDSTTIELPGWTECIAAFDTIFLAEFAQQHHDLLDLDGVSGFVNTALRKGAAISADKLAEAHDRRRAWRAELNAALDTAEMIAVRRGTASNWRALSLSVFAGDSARTVTSQ